MKTALVVIIITVLVIAELAVLYYFVSKTNKELEEENAKLKKENEVIKNETKSNTYLKESFDTGNDTCDVVNILNLMSKHKDK